MSDPVVETAAPAVEATPAPVEGEKPPEKAPEAPTKPKPGEFARKAQAERERVQKANAGKAEHEEFQRTRQERDALKAEIEKISARRQTYLQNPVQVLMDAFPGMEPAKAFEIIGDAARNHGKAPVQTETYALQQRLDAMEAQRKADLEAQQAERQRIAQEQARAAESTFRAEIADFVKENAETYELTALYEQQDAVYEVIDAHFRQTQSETGKGEILSHKKACELVEAKLEEMADRALKTKKVSAKIKPPEPATPRTLTNDLAQSSFGNAAKTEAERMARAMAALDKLG
jgi:hypothetical protein